MRIAIVGAGMAGLACAEALARQGHHLVLVDKGRAAGGRMSTRRIDTPLGTAEFDHGAQYFTVRNAGFRARVDAWIAAGCVAPWPAAGEDAYVGVPGMNAPLRDMAQRLAVRWSERAVALTRAAPGWRVTLQAGSVLDVEAVIVALPAEQTTELLQAAAPGLPILERAPATAPCWTAMLAFADVLPTTLDCLRGAGDAPLQWAARNRAKPGRAGPEAWVLQASPVWSRQHLEANSDDIVATLSAALAARLGTELPPPIAVSTHRWRYARSGAEGSAAVWDANLRMGLCGDWLIGARVEAAWMSGTALAQRIATACV